MKTLDEIDNFEGLKWVQTGRLESRLLAPDNEQVARLIWKNSWGSLATGESADGIWTMKRKGFLHPKITIRSSISDVGIVTMSLGGSGILELAEVPGYRFDRTKQGIAVLDSSGSEILIVRPVVAARSRLEGVIQIEERTRGLPRGLLSLLAILSWYIVVLISSYDNDAAFIAAMTAII